MRVWIQVLVLLAAILSVANAQCLARCGTELCDSPRPASHCHEDPDSTPAASCPHPHFALAGAAGIIHVTLEAAEWMLPASITPFALNPSDARFAVSGDPPGRERPRLCIL